MRKHIILILLALLALGLHAQNRDSLEIELPQPQYMNPFFDSFTRNYISTSAMGRGSTGIALPGGVDNVLINPAGYDPDKPTLHLEMLAKVPVDVNTHAIADTAVYYKLSPQTMSSPVPLGIVGGGGKIGNHFTYGLLYSLPKTVKVDYFGVEINMGAGLIMRYPSYFLNQFTANAAWHMDNFHLGLNLHNQIHYLNDVTILRTFASIRDYKYLLRPQLGFLYTGETVNAGLTATPPQNFDWDLTFAQYDSVLPLQMGLGVAYHKDGTNLTAELDFEQNSAISADFKDRHSIHLGAEKTIRRYTYRAGYIYNPQVWDGNFRLPDAQGYASADTVSIWWDAVMPIGHIGKNSQHIITLGGTWSHPDVRVNLAGMIDVAGKAPVAQVNLSVDLYFSAFNRKEFLYFD
ncbi:MAG: hypothetical protein WCY21_07000 [Candidatus Cloacimonadaceae bacterium]|jgi:hypothetical protein|nr:hypothetical protein [Candidatus Cloacimonadota bacterium]MDX9950159.1 hypothetical protein [Candidatus Syntrophosphaera sp.]